MKRDYFMKRKILVLFPGILIFLCILFPETVSSGAKDGLELWFYSVIPALLPFMILSTFMMKEKITEPVSRMCGPVLSRLFSLPYRCCYPVVIGFLSGFPVGAKVTGQLYQNQEISKEEAEYLLSFCNNASPMFLISFVGVECLHLEVPVEIFFVILFSAWFSSLYTRKKYHVHKEEAGRDTRVSAKKRDLSRPGVIEALDESIMDAFHTMTRIGGYILLFSIVIQMIEDFIPMDHSLKYIGIGFLEITTGGMLFSEISLAGWLKYSIFVGLCAFGGISSIFQTASVIRETGLSLKNYIWAKCLQSVIAFLLSVIWFVLIRTL